jgi:hypothetical protein
MNVVVNNENKFGIYEAYSFDSDLKTFFDYKWLEISEFLPVFLYCCNFYTLYFTINYRTGSSR